MSGEPIFIARKHGTESDDLASLVVLEDGTVLLNDSTLYVERNTIPERIANAAAGGMDPRNIPPGVKVHFCGDIELDDYGVSAREGAWIKVHQAETSLIQRSMGDPMHRDMPMAFDLLHDLLRLGLEQSTLRCVIFEADIVTREEEPAPERPHQNYVALLVVSGLMAEERVQKALDLEPRALPSYGYANALTTHLGYSGWYEVPFAALDEWMKQHGLLDLAPDWWEKERARLEGDEALVRLFAGAQWDAYQLAALATYDGDKPKDPRLVNLTGSTIEAMRADWGLVPLVVEGEDASLHIAGERAHERIAKAFGIDPAKEGADHTVELSVTVGATGIPPGQPHPDDPVKRRAWAEALPVVEGGLYPKDGQPAKLSMLPVQGDDWLVFTYQGETWEIVHDPVVGWARRWFSL